MEITKSLLDQGYEVWGCARKSRSFEHPNFRFTPCDVSSFEHVSRFVEEVSQVWNGVDVLICCAATHGSIGPAMEADPNEWIQGVRSNLEGTYFSIRGFFDLLKKSSLITHRRAKIVCFSGGGATGPRPNFSAYAIAKTGVVRLVENLASEWKSEPVDINAIAPGVFFTPLLEEVLKQGAMKAGKKEYQTALNARTESQSSLEKLLGLIGFLISKDSDLISGKLIAAQWDTWESFKNRKESLMSSDVATLRRVVNSEIQKI